MFKDIVVAIDGSTYSDAAVDYGAYIAVKFEAKIELLHIIDQRFLIGHFIKHFDEVLRSERGEGFADRVKRYYQRHADRIIGLARERSFARGARVISDSIKTGSVAKNIIDRAVTSDLLVIGQRGETAEDGSDSLGSVTERVTHNIEVPALVCQPPVREFRRALLAYDGSAAAHRAMKALVPLAVALKLDVDVVHLIEPHKDVKSLKQAAEYLSRQAIFYETHYLDGDSHALILEHAKEKGTDLLVMGAFSNRQADSLGLGTTTRSMMSQSSIPILIHK